MKQSVSYRAWTTWVFAATGMLVGSIVAVNIVVDAYGILRKDFSRQFQVPNMNVIKMHYLMENKNKYDSFIFGSSRVENIDQSKIPNGRYYNMTYALGLPQEHLENIKYLLQNGVAIRNIIIGVDEFSYQVDPEPRRGGLLTQPLPAISGKRPVDFYSEYYLKLGGLLPQCLAYVRHNITKRDDPMEQRIVYDMFATGRLFCRGCDDEIDRNRKAHDKRFLAPAMYFNADHIAGTIAAIRELVDVCKKNGINLVIFISPSPRITYLSTDLQRLARFKKELSSVTGYFDFSGLNTITEDNYYFYEQLHYRPMVGDMILKVLFGKPDVWVPADFGFPVTAATIDRHLQEQCREIRAIRTSVPLNEANASYAERCATGPSREATTGGVRQE